MRSATRSIVRDACLVLLIGLALLSLASGPGFAQTLPTLPQTFIDTTYSLPTGTTWTVNSGGDFQGALNSANLGDIIILQAGATFTGPFTLPNKASGSGWIYIQSSNYAKLPSPGTRVAPADAANMAKIVVAPASTYAIQTVAGAHHFRFVGVEITPTPGSYLGALVALGSSLETDISQMVHDITFDRCYVHGDPTVGSNKGIAMNGNTIAVVDSYISDLKSTTSGDTNALWAFNSYGPIKIVNNYLEGAGENVFFGGATPTITGMLVSDIEIQYNHFFKPVEWDPADPSYAGTHYEVKNSLEFKHGLRVLVEGNIFENCWADAQTGNMILITPKNETNQSPWVQTSDITFQYNHLINSSSGIAISGGVGAGGSGSGDGPTQQSQRVLIANNLLENMWWTYANGGDGDIINIGGALGVESLTINHNTSITAQRAALYLGYDTPPSPLNSNLLVQNNILLAGSYAVFGPGTIGAGTGGLTDVSSSYTYARNALIGPWPTSGGVQTSAFTGADFWALGFPADVATVKFNNLAGGDYSLAPGSPYKNTGTDGKDIGVDMSGLNAETSGVVAGTPTVSNASTSAAAASSKGGGCFIATAAYGSSLETEVVLLRTFRDQHLLTNRAGRAFVQWYYRVSPPLAARIQESAFLKGLVRTTLWPVVGVVWLVFHPGIGAGLMVGGGILGWLRSRRKRKSIG